MITRSKSARDNLDESSFEGSAATQLMTKNEENTNQILLERDIVMREADENSSEIIADIDETTMKRELVALRKEKKIAHLRAKLERVRAEKIQKFLVDLSMRSRDSDELNKKKILRVVDFKRYRDTKQHDLNVFVRECQNVFDIRLLTYVLNKDKILYAQEFLDDISIENWFRRRVFVDLTIMTWQDFVNFLQKQLNLKHLRMLDLNSKLKKVQ